MSQDNFNFNNDNSDRDNIEEGSLKYEFTLETGFNYPLTENEENEILNKVEIELNEIKKREQKLRFVKTIVGNSDNRKIFELLHDIKLCYPADLHGMLTEVFNYEISLNKVYKLLRMLFKKKMLLKYATKYKSSQFRANFPKGKTYFYTKNCPEWLLKELEEEKEYDEFLYLDEKKKFEYKKDNLEIKKPKTKEEQEQYAYDRNFAITRGSIRGVNDAKAEFNENPELNKKELAKESLALIKIKEYYDKIEFRTSEINNTHKERPLEDGDSSYRADCDCFTENKQQCWTVSLAKRVIRESQEAIVKIVGDQTPKVAETIYDKLERHSLLLSDSQTKYLE